MSTDELQQQLSALEGARLKLLTGERVVEVRFGDKLSSAHGRGRRMVLRGRFSRGY